jgi:hypothetical protein
MPPRFVAPAAVLTLAAVAAVFATALSPAGAADSQAYVLTQQLGPGHGLELTVSSAGAAATEYRKDRPVAGVVANYDDRTLYTLDYTHKTYTAEAISGAVKWAAQQRGLMRKARTEVEFKTPSGLPEYPPPALEKTDLQAKIDGLPAQAYILRQSGAVQRLWLGLDMPAPPADLQKLVGRVVAVPSQAGGVVLRAEVLSGKKWIVGLDTVENHVVDLKSDAFGPPDGWKRGRVPARALATVPATVLRLGGPVSTRPDVFSLYWGPTFSAGFRVTMNTFLSSLVGGPAPSPYWGPMAQYGVTRGAFIGSASAPGSLPPSVGSWNFLAIANMVVTAYVTTAAPKIWWRFGDRDPLIAIFVPANLVDAGGWGGYHLLSPSPAWLLPWPVSLAAYPMMPWLIAKSPIVGGVPSVTATTVTATHELVEAASDPVPLSANFDPSKSPPWVGGEIADICSVGISSTTFRFGFTAQNYWSNAARACVG